MEQEPQELITPEEYERIRGTLQPSELFCVLCGEIYPQWLQSTHYFTCSEIGE